MSLVVYTGDTLAVDRSGCTIDTHRKDETVFIPTNVGKFFKTSDERIAVAYTGPEVDFKSDLFKEQLAIFRRVLANANGGAEGVNLSVGLLNDLEKVIFFVITANVCYEVIPSKKKTSNYISSDMVALDKSHFTFHGTGKTIAEYLSSIFLIKSKTDLEGLFYRTADRTDGMWRTTVDMVSHSDLKPF